MYSKYYLIPSIYTFLARAGSNSRDDACFLAINHTLQCGCVCQLRPVQAAWRTMHYRFTVTTMERSSLSLLNQVIL